MKGKIIFLSVTAALIMGLLVGATMAQATTGPTQDWVTIASFTGASVVGTESVQTNNFNVPTRSWRMQITIQLNAGHSGLFIVAAYPLSNQLTLGQMSLYGPGTYTNYIRADPGTFWINIYASNVNWTIDVQTQT